MALVTHSYVWNRYAAKTYFASLTKIEREEIISVSIEYSIIFIAVFVDKLQNQESCMQVPKNNVNAFHGNEWMKEHNFALQNAEIRPRLQSRTQNICLVISISAVILKLKVKITSIFGSYRYLRIAWYDIVSLSHHLPASTPRAVSQADEQMLIFSSSLTPGRLKGRFPFRKKTRKFRW